MSVTRSHLALPQQQYNSTFDCRGTYFIPPMCTMVLVIVSFKASTQLPVVLRPGANQVPHRRSLYHDDHRCTSQVITGDHCLCCWSVSHQQQHHCLHKTLPALLQFGSSPFSPEFRWCMCVRVSTWARTYCFKFSLWCRCGAPLHFPLVFPTTTVSVAMSAVSLGSGRIGGLMQRKDPKTAKRVPRPENVKGDFFVDHTCIGA